MVYPCLQYYTGHTGHVFRKISHLSIHPLREQVRKAKVINYNLRNKNCACTVINTIRFKNNSTAILDMQHKICSFYLMRNKDIYYYHYHYNYVKAKYTTYKRPFVQSCILGSPRLLFQGFFFCSSRVVSVSGQPLMPPFHRLSQTQEPVIKLFKNRADKNFDELTANSLQIYRLRYFVSRVYGVTYHIMILHLN